MENRVHIAEVETTTAPKPFGAEFLSTAPEGGLTGGLPGETMRCIWRGTWGGLDTEGICSCDYVQ